jgi:rhodanese-related sulfurtransferase
MRRIVLRAAIIGAAALMLMGAVQAAENWPDSVDEYVKQVRATVQTTDMDGFLAAVKDPQGALLLDVREADEYAAGHVPGVAHIPRGFLEFRIWKQLGYPAAVDTGRKIYVHCLTGGRATLAARQLKDVGFTDVVAVVMNFGEWEKKGYPLAK